MSETTELEIPTTLEIDAERHEAHHEEQHDEPRRRHPRDDMMAEIARRRSEAIDRELLQGEEYADQARAAAGLEPIVHETPAADETAPEPPQEAPQATQRTKRPNLRNIEIDGQSFQVTDEQFEQLAQMGARANVAMSQQQNAANPQRQQQPAPQQRQQPSQPRPVLTKEDAEAVADRILYGGREQVAETVAALAGHIAQQARQEQISIDTVAAEAARRALEQTQLHADLSTISGEYAEIWQERALGELAAVQLAHVRQEDQVHGRQRTNLDSYREACNRVMDALGKPRPGNPQQRTATQAASTRPVASSDRSQVLERKRVAPAQPQALGLRSSQTQTVRPKSGSEIVEAMRKARGQMAMI